MKLLAIDTTETACSVALALDGDAIWRYRVAPRQHSELVLPMAAELLEEAGLPLSRLDAIAFSRGPGSFTGVRIATAVAQGLALGADLPLVPVSTLLSLAQGAFREAGAAHVLAALDARMGELYWAAVEVGDEGPRLLSEERVAPPPRVTAPGRDDWVAVGSGWDAHLEALMPRFRPVRVLHGWQIHARDVAAVGAVERARGGGVPPERALPVYLRNEVAKKSAVQPLE